MRVSSSTVRRPLKTDPRPQGCTPSREWTPALVLPLVEDFTPPGRPYLALGQEVDLELIVRTFADKNRQPCSRLRITRMVNEF